MRTRIGVSACLLGEACNFNGKDLLSAFIKELSQLPEIEFIHFCPEHSVFGTPRPNLRIVGGDGFDVLNGNSRVIDENGKDVTELLMEGAHKFLDRLKKAYVGHAILMDGSPSCGSNVLLKEDGWPRGGFKRGIGVAAALLRNNAITVLSSFDERSICEFLKTINLDNLTKHNPTDLRDIPKFKHLFQS